MRRYVQLISDVRRSYGKHVAIFAGYGAMDRGNQEYRAAVQAAVDQANAGSHKFTPGEQRSACMYGCCRL